MSNLARDIVYETRIEEVLTQAQDALTQCLVFDYNFFARRGPRTDYLTLPQREVVARHIRMCDACSEAVVCVACVFDVWHDGRSALWLEARRGHFELETLDAEHDILISQQVWSAGVDYERSGVFLHSPRTVEEALSRFNAKGAFDGGDIGQRIACANFCAGLCELLAP